jgi:glutamate-1-semialdehyde aminotransferase
VRRGGEVRSARGIALAPSRFEANFISAAHTADDIAQTVAAIADALNACH